MDSITMLRGSSNWNYVQKNMFPGQGEDLDKVFVFKMSEVGPGSGVDLVKRMQAGGDLENAWIMFDHVKRVRSWTTMACHVYDSTYCRVMTIAVCDMQSEDVAAQSVVWKNLNAVMAPPGVQSVNFKGFMADSAQANWNAVRIIYGSGDATEKMVDKERTCLFHWMQSLEKHTKADIRQDLQSQHQKSANSTRMPSPWRRLRLSILQFEHGGCHPVLHLNKAYLDWSFGLPSGISVTANGVDLWSW